MGTRKPLYGKMGDMNVTVRSTLQEGIGPSGASGGALEAKATTRKKTKRLERKKHIHFPQGTPRNGGTHMGEKTEPRKGQEEKGRGKSRVKKFMGAGVAPGR